MSTLPSRVTVVETIYHQDGAGGDPVAIGQPFSQELRSDEQPFIRLMKVQGMEWKPIETGWIVRCSMLHIRNVGGPALEVTLQGATSPMMLPPKSSLRFCPLQLSTVLVRCVSVDKPGKCEVSIIPE